MKKLICLTALITLLLSCVSSKRTIFLTPPPVPAAIGQIDLASYEAKYGKYDGVYLSVEKSFEHTGGKEELTLAPKSTAGLWHFYEVSKERTLILNPDEQKLSTFNLKVPAGAKLGNLYLYVTYPNGDTKQFGEADLKQETDGSKSRIYKFAYPNIQKGCIIEEGFEITYSLALGSVPPISHDIPLQFVIPCEHLSFSYAYPDWWEIQVKKVAEDSIPSYKTKQDPENHKITITYQADDIPALEAEAYSPYFKEMASYLEFMVTSLQMQGRSYSSHKTWKALMSTLQQAEMNKDGFLSNHVSNMTKDIIKGIESPLERLDTIITYLQKNIEVTNDYDSRNFKSILKDKKGSVTRITGLAQSMLAKAGLDARYLLVHSAADGYFDKAYVSFSQFTIPAIGVAIENEKFVVFPYAKVPINYIPQQFQGQLALGVSEDKNLTDVDFWEVPTGDRTANITGENYDLKIDEQGTITVSEASTLRGSKAYTMRQSLEDLTNEELDDELEKLLTYTDGNINIISRKITNLDAFKKPLIIELTYTIDNLITMTPEEIIFRTGGLLSPLSGTKYKIDSEDRHNPIRIHYDETLDKHITIHFPENWEIETPLKNVEFENMFGKVAGEYQIAAGRIEVKQQRRLKRCDEPRESIGELLDLTGERSKLAVPAIVFKSGVQSEKGN